MSPFLPPKSAPVVFGLLVSGLMTLIVSGIATLNALGLSDSFVDKWISAWGASWIFAFPIILFVAPMAKHLVDKMIKQDNKD